MLHLEHKFALRVRTAGTRGVDQAHCRAAAHCEAYPGELSLDECKAVMDDIASITDPILIVTGGWMPVRA